MYLIDELEKMQKWATKILRQCRHLNYQQHLEFLNLPTQPLEETGVTWYKSTQF